MPSTQVLQWIIWGLSILAGIGAVLALFKLRYAERFLPQWNELKELEAILPVRREEVRQAMDVIENCRKEIGHLEATLGHLRILREWQDANPEAPARIQQLMSEIERAKAELTTFQQKLAQEEARMNKILGEVNRLSQERTQLAEQIPSLQTQLANLYRQKAELESQVRRFEDQRSQLDQKLSNVKREVETCESRLAKTQQQLNQAEQERTAAIRERDQARTERDTAKAELVGLHKSIDQLKELAKGMQVNLERAGVTGPASGYKDLFAPVFNGRYLSPARTSHDERGRLEQARDYIRSKGLVFPERVLYAFHTSLKTADISPLVVLAGISGSGKSELPRHYADGMGMHFLLVSVQPRWDSPQDLFGFYNYLEKRYKATELARALIQFERFNQGAWEDAFDNVEIADRSDRLLLVLLDEMNLARTEYYFSEFLSKLETRRLVNEDNADDRARAEIELDMGSLLDGGKTIRLYPGRNVLFAGTMNEDESTQALSDKVVDRACVLRFWRPRKTNPEIMGGKTPAPQDGLTFENWQKWLRPSTALGPHAKDVDEWIQRLNDALTRMGRPFAFRVDKAVRCYVANYPQWVANWHKRAMADQIEQRIFPRLRGIEPDKFERELGEIGRLIDELEDELLKKAFQESWENQSTFLFRGVVRDE